MKTSNKCRTTNIIICISDQAEMAAIISLPLCFYSIYIGLTAYYTTYLYTIYTLDFTGYIWTVFKSY